MPVLANAILAGQLAYPRRDTRTRKDDMLTRADIFREGLTQATGFIHYLHGKLGPISHVDADNPPIWGSLTLDGSQRIEYFFSVEWFPAEDQNQIQLNSRVRFDAAPNQIDTKFLDLPPRTKRPKPKIKNPRLIVTPEVNYNR